MLSLFIENGMFSHFTIGNRLLIVIVNVFDFRVDEFARIYKLERRRK
jgi:hypothetical protein